MGMRIQLNVFEALTEAGVKPEAARNAERAMEAAIEAGTEALRAEMHEQQTKAELAAKAGEDAVRAEMRDQLMTKTDGAQLEARLLRAIHEQTKAMNEQTWKLVGFVVVANGLMLAVLRLLPN